ncbi:MAG: D-fructose-6-phosphate amidotransferase [Magnetovibrio sp.]|nr:D-fructose-6-phosphate amidotransferase [Magnetovibrio sp.]
MPAYFIAQVEVNDADVYDTYRKQVPSTLEPFGGEFIVRGGKMEVMEGEWPMPRCVVIKFPDMEKAKAWHSSDAYAGPKALRQKASRGNAIVIEGA